VGDFILSLSAERLFIISSILCIVSLVFRSMENKIRNLTIALKEGDEHATYLCERFYDLKAENRKNLQQIAELKFKLTKTRDTPIGLLKDSALFGGTKQ